MPFTKKQETTLLDVAQRSIQSGLNNGMALNVDVNTFDAALQVQQSSFVTLHLEHTLRGCIGALYATQPLIVDVAQHAYGAAFNDPRFPPLREVEFASLNIHISVLNPPEPLVVNDEAALLKALRVGIDGLILQVGYHRATFLPAVWESLPNPHDFVTYLKQKAGLSKHYWSDAVQVWRYTVTSIPAE